MLTLDEKVEARAAAIRRVPDDRRIVVPVLVLFVFAVFIIIVVGVSRRDRVVDDGDGAPFDQPGGNDGLGGTAGPVGSCPVWRAIVCNRLFRLARLEAAIGPQGVRTQT